MDLASHKFILLFDPEQAEELCQAAIIEKFTHKTVLFKEGEKSDCLYLILEGSVEFQKQVGENRYQTLTQAGPNAFFGELGLLDGQPRSAHAIVFEDSILAKIPDYRMMKVLDGMKGSKAIEIFSYMTQRLRDSTEQYIKQVVHKQKMVLLGEMVNTVIHDFKSPLSSITLASGMLKEQHDDEDTIEWCDLIKAQAQRIADMAEEFLEFTQGEAALNKKPMKLADALRYFERLNRVYLNQASVELTIDCDENIILNADENKLLRVWQNLVGNAVEAFMERGGKIEILARAKGREVETIVRDNGPGIPEEIKSRLFESFVTYGKRGGTGLGTAIAKSMIDAHDGRISFESNPDGGTTFHIYLPLYPG
ncbi:MAG: ATP-binding protein [Cyanobacteriota bacterium]|nr:ATP-binding protein [Cyanobacteriota bacterium]